MAFPKPVTKSPLARHFAALRLFRLGLILILPLAANEIPPPLSTISEIRQLTVEQAKSGLPVKINGVVTFSKPSIATLFVHDGTAGIFIEQTPGPDITGPKSGDQVEVTGITGEGMFATVIKGLDQHSASVTVTGHGPLPEPRVIDGSELSRPGADSDWIAIDAWVKEVSMDDGDLILACTAGTCEFHVLLEGPLPPESVPWDLAESRVRVRGVVATTFNMGRQMTIRFMRVESLADITPLDHNESQAGEPRLVRADELLRSTGPGPGELVRIRGVATLALPGRGLFLQVDGGGLWVQTAQPVAAAPGTVIEVIGWPRPGEMKPFIRARRASVMGSTTPPQAIPLKASKAIKAQHDAEWVSVEAELLDSFNGPDGMILELRDTDTVFRGLLPHDTKIPMPKLEPGSQLRITGICRITPTGNFILQVEDKLLILAGSANDVKVLAPPPFWTTRNVTIAAFAVITALLAFYGIARGRRRREQKTQRREFEAVLAERGRFAREIHDSLAQGLTSISLQLECVRDRLTEDPAAAASHVEKARGFVRDSLREARRTVWNLRPLALGEADLASTLQRYAANLSDNGKISISQEIEGTPRPLPPDHESALLRIGHEALTNAARHAAATEVRQRLRFGNGWVTLTVMDNGKGFDVAAMVGKGFGLTGMHERVAALGGSLSIDSRPGHGTEVSATLPI
jgi:signal transduction histidine kinase